MSDILRGKRVVTEKLAHRFIKRLGLDREQRDHLMRAVSFTQTKRMHAADDRVIATTESLFQKINLETFEMLSQWYYLATLAIAELDDNRFDELWLAQRLRIERMQAHRVLQVFYTWDS